MTDINAVRDTGRAPSGGPTDKHNPVPAIIDWALGGLVGLLGLVLAVLGISEFRAVDRRGIADSVNAETVEGGGLTRSEVIDAAVPFVNWVTAGVAITGVVFVVAAALFVRSRRQTRRRVEREGGTTATFWACTIYGSAVAMLTPIPLVSTLFGGGVAASLSDTDASSRIGALAGVIGSVLGLPILLFLGAGIVAGAAAIGELAGGLFVVGFLAVVQLAVVVFYAGLGALGGFLAERFV